MKTVYTLQEKSELESQWWNHLGDNSEENVSLITQMKQRYKDYEAYCRAFKLGENPLFSRILIERYGSKAAKEILRKFEAAEKENMADDNFRAALKENPEQMEEYKALQSKGCCGFYEDEISIDGKTYKIGANYGH